MYTRIRLLLLFVFFFIFLSLQFSNKCFVTLFSGAVRPRQLKLGTHLDNGWMYCVYQNQAAAAYSSLYFLFFFFSNFQTLNIFHTLFSGPVRPRRLKLGTHVDNGWMYHVYRNQTAIHSFIFSFFFQFSNIKICLLHFSQEVWGLEGGNVIPMWIMSGCIVSAGIRLLLCIYPFIFSFFFLSNFQALKIFVTFFSGTVRPTRLKLGTHVDNGWCIVYTRIRLLLLLIHPFIFIFLNFHFFLFLQFSVHNNYAYLLK